MRYVVKKSAPGELVAWVQEKVKLGERADYRLGIPDAPGIRQSALREQYGLCVYTGRAITECTLEHIKPYSVCKAEWDDANLAGEDVDWNNLVGAYKTYEEPHFGESIRDNWYDQDYISPLERDCGSHFTFEVDGSIDSTSARGAAMISKLRLDEGRLTEERRAAIDVAVVELSDHWDTHRSITNFLANYCSVHAGKLPSFAFVLESALPKLA